MFVEKIRQNPVRVKGGKSLRNGMWNGVRKGSLPYNYVTNSANVETALNFENYLEQRYMLRTNKFASKRVLSKRRADF